MNIQYYGDYCFKLTAKPHGRATEDVVIVTDMPEKGMGIRSPQGEANLVLLSHQSREAEALALIKGAPVTLSTPGEYAAAGISLIGLASYRDEKSGELRGQNTIFLFEVEDLTLCYLGALGHMLEGEVLEKITGVDILFVPASGYETLPVQEVDDLIRKIEPKVVIPMHYKMEGMTGPLPDFKNFCKTVGNCPAATLPKWNVKAKDLEGKNMEVVILDRN